jgi:hypothetical protein
MDMVLIKEYKKANQLHTTGLFMLFCPAGQTGPVGGSASAIARPFRYERTFGPTFAV